MLRLTSLSTTQARALHLAAQGLLSTPTKAATRPALRACIAQMQLLQIDTIHVVSRSPYLVLHARLGDYPPDWLEDALAQGHVFETWAHEACFAPTFDLPMHRTYNAGARKHWGLIFAERSATSHRQQCDQLLTHIREKGPVKSSDFERKDGGGGAWWGWKDEKRWLEALFAQGELMVARRENFHRVYDLTERVAPQLAGTGVASLKAEQAHVAFIEKAITALGITQARWVNDYFRQKPRLKDSDLNDLVDAGTILRVQVDGWEAPAYVHASNSVLLRKARTDKLQASHTCLLSPFDPVVWDRERASTFFDFDYRLECYTPELQRRYGYFVLPILCRGALIGRLDAKAHRADGVFEVRALYAQEDICWATEQIEDVARAIHRSAEWHKTPVVKITRTQPTNLAAPLRKALKVLAN
jgi:uncharacterized protein YcaQ